MAHMASASCLLSSLSETQQRNIPNILGARTSFSESMANQETEGITITSEGQEHSRGTFKFKQCKSTKSQFAFAEREAPPLRN